jgi:hypothetical protein
MADSEEAIRIPLSLDAEFARCLMPKRYSPAHTNSRHFV